MKKLAKVLGILAAVFVVLVIAAAVAVKIFFPPEKIKALVIAQAEQNLHRKMEVSSVDFGLFQGLQIQGVRLSEKPDFDAGEFMKADAFTFRFEWLPLLHKELVASRLELDGLKVTVKKRRDGTTNIPTMEAAAAKAKGPSPAQSAPSPAGRGQGEGAAAGVALTVKTFRVKDADVTYIDEAARSQTTLKVPLASISDFSLNGAFPFSAKVELAMKTGKQTQSATVETEGTVDLGNLDQEKIQADIKTLKVTSGGVTVSGSVKFQNAKSPKLDADFKTPPLDSKALAALSGAAVPEGLKLPESRLSLSAEYGAPTFSVSAFKFEAAGMTVTGKLSVPDVNAKRPRISLQAQSNTFDLAGPAEILAMTRGKGLSGKASFKASAQGFADDPDLPDLQLHAELAALKPDTVQAFLPAGQKSPLPPGVGLPAMRFDLSAAKSGGTLTLNEVAMAAGELKAKVSGKVSSLETKNPSLRLAFNTDTIDFASFAPYLPQISKLTGKARLSANVEGASNAPKVAGTFELSGAGAEYLQQRLENFTGTVKFSETALEMPKLTGKVNGGDLTLKMSAVDPKAPVVTVNGTLSVLDAGALEALMSQAPQGPGAAAAPAAAPAKPAPYTGPVVKTSGAFTIGKITHPNFNSGQATMDWNLTGLTPELKLLNGSAKLNVAAGKAVGLLDIAKKKGGLARAMVTPLEALDKVRGKIPGVSIPDLKEIPFDKIYGNYVFKQGVMTMEPSALQGPTLNSTTNGTVNLVSMALDLKTSLGVAQIGTVGLTIKGTADDPDVKPDLTGVKKQATEEAQKLLKEQGQKLLKGLFK